jgi:putative transcriptional regulator
MNSEGQDRTFAAYVRSLRAYLKLTQEQLADMLETRQQTISDWENGVNYPHRSNRKSVSQIATAAGFSGYEEPRHE